MRRHPPSASSFALVVGLAAALASVGCRRAEPPAPPPPEPAASPPAAPGGPPDEPPPARPFDPEMAEFDTVEVSPRGLARPDPAPPAPPPAPEPPADPDAVSGQCDVRPAEAFCFTYVGPGWAPATARAHCARAPGGRFDGRACPADERIGTCRFERPGGGGEVLVYSYYAPYPVDLARLACPGEFTEDDAP